MHSDRQRVAAPVIRIAGVSYSGSTALGYFLNTSPAVIFGSELYRLLPAYMHAGEPRSETPCDLCGSRCATWSKALRAKLLSRPDTTLADVYDAFFEQAGPTVVLVDGSKSLHWYQPAPRRAVRYIVSVKHPLRMAASHLYNDGHLIPAARRESLADAHRWLAERPETVRPRLQALMAGLRERYLALLPLVDTSSGTRWCHSDDLADVQSMLAELGRDLDLRFDLDATARTPCHALGGNRSLTWQSRGWAQAPLNPVRDSARWAYYLDQGSTGFILDNKHETLLAGPVAEWAVEAAAAAGLFELFNYAERP